MNLSLHAWAAHGATASFVLLWGSGAIFTRLGLDHASPFAFLVLRFALALAVLALAAAITRQSLPAPGRRLDTAATGLAMIGAYAICYFLAMDHGVTPGVLATVLGVQPIATLLWLERGFSPLRLAALLLALAGLVLVVYQNIGLANASIAGMTYALAALACITVGAIRQKGALADPMRVLPLQYAASLGLCLLFVPFKPFRFEPTLDFMVPLIWLAIVISVVAQILLYRLIRAGNLVNVTSLFYLVPGVTAIMDYFVLGNLLGPLSVLGMGLILAALAVVFRTSR